MQPTPIFFGNGVILATTSDFQQGFQAGQNDYRSVQAFNPDPFTDEALTGLFLEKLEDMTLSSLYGVGFAAGFLNALATASNAKGDSHA